MIKILVSSRLSRQSGSRGSRGSRGKLISSHTLMGFLLLGPGIKYPLREKSGFLVPQETGFCALAQLSITTSARSSGLSCGTGSRNFSSGRPCYDHVYEQNYDFMMHKSTVVWKMQAPKPLGNGPVKARLCSVLFTNFQIHHPELQSASNRSSILEVISPPCWFCELTMLCAVHVPSTFTVAWRRAGLLLVGRASCAIDLALCLLCYQSLKNHAPLHIEDES